VRHAGRAGLPARPSLRLSGAGWVGPASVGPCHPCDGGSPPLLAWWHESPRPTLLAPLMPCVALMPRVLMPAGACVAPASLNSIVIHRTPFGMRGASPRPRGSQQDGADRLRGAGRGAKGQAVSSGGGRLIRAWSGPATSGMADPAASKPRALGRAGKRPPAGLAGCPTQTSAGRPAGLGAITWRVRHRTSAQGLTQARARPPIPSRCRTNCRGSEWEGPTLSTIKPHSACVAPGSEWEGVVGVLKVTEVRAVTDAGALL
jgi:hypothetical protein